jgi:hypothetical protein
VYWEYCPGGENSPCRFVRKNNDNSVPPTPSSLDYDDVVSTLSPPHDGTSHIIYTATMTSLSTIVTSTTERAFSTSANGRIVKAASTQTMTSTTQTVTSRPTGDVSPAAMGLFAWVPNSLPPWIILCVCIVVMTVVLLLLRMCLRQRRRRRRLGGGSGRETPLERHRWVIGWVKLS